MVRRAASSSNFSSAERRGQPVTNDMSCCASERQHARAPFTDWGSRSEYRKMYGKDDDAFVFVARSMSCSLRYPMGKYDAFIFMV